MDKVFPVRFEVLTALIIKITGPWDVKPCRLVESQHAQHCQLATESHGAMPPPRILKSTPSGQQQNCVKKHYLNLFRLISKPTSLFIIYIRNILYIILISLFLWGYSRWHTHTTTHVPLVLRLGYTSSTHIYKVQCLIKYKDTFTLTYLLLCLLDQDDFPAHVAT